MSKTVSQGEKRGGKAPTPSALFISMGIDMSWRLTLGVLVPIIGGVELDRGFNTSPLFLILGFVAAIAGTVLVIRRTVKAANAHPIFNDSKKEVKK